MVPLSAIPFYIKLSWRFSSSVILESILYHGNLLILVSHKFRFFKF